MAVTTIGACRESAPPRSSGSTTPPSPPAASSAGGASDRPSDALADLRRKLEPALDAANGSRPAGPVASDARPPADEQPTAVETPAVTADAPPASVETSVDLDEAERHELLESAATFAASIATRLRAGGDAKSLDELVVTEEELRSLLAEGQHRILAMGLPVTRKRLAAYCERLQGKVESHEWAPGTLRQTPLQGGWKTRAPILMESVLTVDTGAAAVLIHIEQLLRVGDGWKVFRLR